MSKPATKPAIVPVSFPWDFEQLYALSTGIENRWKVLARYAPDEAGSLGIYIPPCKLCLLDTVRTIEHQQSTGYLKDPKWCSFCPIGLDVQSKGMGTSCGSTPYIKWSAKPTKENAQAELDYLEDLRDRMLASLDYSDICGHDRKQKAYMEKHFRYFDNEGQTFDQYTIINTDPDLLTRNRHPSYGASEHPFHPQGFGQYSEVNREIVVSFLGKEVDLEDLPEDVQKLALQLIPE